MSRRWVRALFVSRCGYCGRRMEVDQAMQLIDGAWKVPKVRCAQCADRPVDEIEIAAWDAKRAEINRARSVASQPTTYVDGDRTLFDGKAAAAGDEQ